MSLLSTNMALSRAERSWLPLWGRTGKLVMKWSCGINRDRYPALENTFESFASTRVKLLTQWATLHWQRLEVLAQQCALQLPQPGDARLTDAARMLKDASELSFVQPDGKVLASSVRSREGSSGLNAQALAQGLKAPFLHGPYIDPVTRTLGPTSSRFHDAVTLMFYQPVIKDGVVLGCLCARVPNDVMSDLIQREAGHIFHESGDNYLFMVRSVFDRSIVAGTALSRSRFEDGSVNQGGANLKDGVKTAYGVVRVREHTEFELVFNDPATGQ